MNDNVEHSFYFAYFYTSILLISNVTFPYFSNAIFIYVTYVLYYSQYNNKNRQYVSSEE